MNDYNSETLDETKTLLTNPEKHVLSAFDVADKQAFQDFSEAVIAKFGEVDAIINNAGITLDLISAQQTDWDAFEKVIGINMWGMIYGSRFFLPALKERSEACIANVSSVFGIMGVPKQAAYCTSKFALTGLTKCMGAEFAALGYNIRVNSVHPGGVDTPCSIR